jgi:hypothetical protein
MFFSKSVFLSKLLRKSVCFASLWGPPHLSLFGRSRPAGRPAFFFFVFCIAECFSKVFTEAGRLASVLYTRPGISWHIRAHRGCTRVRTIRTHAASRLGNTSRSWLEAVGVKVLVETVVRRYGCRVQCPVLHLLLFLLFDCFVV